jgi:hypothetical protein
MVCHDELHSGALMNKLPSTLSHATVVRGHNSTITRQGTPNFLLAVVHTPSPDNTSLSNHQTSHVPTGAQTLSETSRKLKLNSFELTKFKSWAKNQLLRVQDAVHPSCSSNPICQNSPSQSHYINYTICYFVHRMNIRFPDDVVAFAACECVPAMLSRTLPKFSAGDWIRAK